MQQVEFFWNCSEEEKVAIRRKYGLKEYSEDEKEVYLTFKAMSMELQKEKGYLTAEDDKELRRRFQAWLIEREQSKEKEK